MNTSDEVNTLGPHNHPGPETVWSPTADLFDKLRNPGPTRDVMAEVFELQALLNTVSLMASRLNPELDEPTIAYATAEMRNAADRLRMAITQLEGLRPLTQERTQWEPGNDTPARNDAPNAGSFALATRSDIGSRQDERVASTLANLPAAAPVESHPHAGAGPAAE